MSENANLSENDEPCKVFITEPYDVKHYGIRVNSNVNEIIVSVMQDGTIGKLDINKLLDHPDCGVIRSLQAVVKECIAAAEVHSEKAADATRNIRIGCDDVS